MLDCKDGEGATGHGERRPAVGYVLHRYPELTQTFVRLEIEELRRQGVEVEVLALGRGAGELDGGGRVRWVHGDLGVSKLAVAAAHARLLARHPARYARARRLVLLLGPEGREVRWRRLPWFAAQLADAGVSWLHAHFAWSGAATAAVLAELMGLPWSMTMHANDIFSDRRNLELKLARADHLVTVCDYNRRWLESHHTLRRPLTMVVCGVDVPPEPSTDDPDVDVVAVGRLVEKKGLDTLIEAVHLLHQRRPGLSVEIVGDGPLRKALDDLVWDLGLQRVVRMRGALTHDLALDRIDRARLLCLPARVASDGDRDSMPVVVKEAMARGVPPVVSDAVGMPEMVDDSCGWVVPAGDAERLADALEAALSDPAEARRRGAAGRDRVLERFTVAGEVAKLRQIFTGSGPRP